MESILSLTNSQLHLPRRFGQKNLPAVSTRSECPTHLIDGLFKSRMTLTRTTSQAAIFSLPGMVIFFFPEASLKNC